MDQIFQRFSQFNRHIATAISVAVVVLLSLSIANTVLFVLDAMNPPNLEVSGAIDSGKLSAGTLKSQFKVSTVELFGSTQQATTTAVVDAPQTKLDLELHGVFINEDPAKSTAIVAQKNKDGELFSIGDRLPGNATLESVFEDHVLIRRGTRVEKLQFADSGFRLASDFTAPLPGTFGSPDTLSGFAQAGMPGQTPSEMEQIRERIRRRMQPGSADEPQASAELMASVADYQRKFEEDPDGTLTELGISSVANGESKGYVLGAEASQPALQQAGLQPGDVVLSVNGRPVGDARSDSALFQQVMSSQRVRVEVQRDSRRFYLTVPIPGASGTSDDN